MTKIIGVNPPPPPRTKSIGYRRITCLEKFHLLSIYLSQYEKKIVLLLVVKRAYIVCFTIFKRDIFCSSLLASDFCYRGKKLRVLNIIDIFRHHPSTPLITLLTMSGNWDQEETKMAAETRACLKHELYSDSTVCFPLQHRGLNG